MSDITAAIQVVLQPISTIKEMIYKKFNWNCKVNKDNWNSKYADYKSLDDFNQNLGLDNWSNSIK